MIGDLDRSTNNNIEHQSIEFVTQSLTPWLVRWEEALKYAFLDPDDDNLCLNFPTIALLRGDMAARSAYINTSIMNGTMTPNEGRVMEGRNPDANPKMDQPLRMLNMVTLGSEEESGGPLKKKLAKAQPAPAEPDTDDMPQNAADSRLYALASASADRVARKEMESVAKILKSVDFQGGLIDFYGRHASFVSSVLGVSGAKAGDYCIEQIDRFQHGANGDIAELMASTKQTLLHLALKG